MAYEMASSLWRCYHMRGFLFAARELLDDLLESEGASVHSRARALEAAGGVAYWSGDMSASLERYQEALDLLRALGEPRPIAYGLYNLAFAKNYVGNAGEARDLLEQAHAIFSDLGDEAGMAATTWGLGDAWAVAGELGKARQCFEQSIAVFERLDDRFGLGWAHYTQGEVLTRLGEYESARDHLERGLRLFDISDVSAVVMYLAALAVAEGDLLVGAQLAGAMTGLRDETGTDLVRVGVNSSSHMDPDGFGLREGELGVAYARGRAMSAQDAVGLAISGSSAE